MKLNPFVGLNSLKKEEYQNLDPFLTYRKVEELCPSYQKGQVGDMFLFFYFINLLTKANIDFLIKGGVLLNIYLGTHARPCEDIDVYVKDPFLFFEETNKVLNKNTGDFRFLTKWIKSRAANKNYYQNTFAFEVSAYHNDDLIKSFIVDGTYLDDYDDLKKVKYSGPKVVDEDFYFYGVSLVHMVSIKTLAATSEQPRPVKHLVDLYSLIHLSFDINEYTSLLFKQLDDENRIRKSLGIPILSRKLRINENKEFFDSFFLTELSAGYNMSLDEMINEINLWLTTNVN